MKGLRVLKLGGYFNASTPSAATLLDMLKQCPDLEEFALRNMSAVDSDPCSIGMLDDFDRHVPSKIHLPRLKKLTFHYSGIAHTREILSNISYPNLESLELAYLENTTGLFQMLHAQALTRLPLKHLHIETCVFNEMQFVNLLRKLPSLRTLKLVDIEDISYISLKVC